MRTTAKQTRKCPEDCIYRNKYAPFCGYCLPDIMKRREEAKDAGGQNDTEDTEQAE